MAVILLALIAGAFYFSSKGAQPGTQTLVLTGTVRLGEQVGIDYCKEGVYLDVANDQFSVIQLRKSDGSMDFGNEFLLQYLGKNVQATVKYDPNKVQCQALICSCDDYALLQEIKVA